MDRADKLQNIQTLIIVLPLLLLTLHYHGHIELMGDEERQQKLDKIQKELFEKGCLPKKKIRQKYNLTKLEFLEIVRNASNYRKIIDSRKLKTYEHPAIIRCYMKES